MARVRGQRAGGLQIRWDPDTDRRIEWATHTCKHCNSVLDVTDGLSARDKMLHGLNDGVGGFCEHCQSAVCHRCAAAAYRETDKRKICRPFVDRIDAALRQQALRRAMGLGNYI